MGKDRTTRCVVSMIISLLMIITSGPGMVFAAGEGLGDPSCDVQTTGDYAPGEVIVMFREGAVRQKDTSLRSARALGRTGKDYGLYSAAAGEAGEAASDAGSEIKILEKSLGDDFVLEDSMEFGNADDPPAGLLKSAADESSDTLRIALVTSDKYSTDEMIGLLSRNPDVAAAEPDSYIHFESYDSYSLNDTYSSYLYQNNSPAAENTATDGESVSSRGYDPEAAITSNAASAWKKLTGNEKETVVALVDSGINLENEDLKNMLWTKPEGMDLAGVHGYNFGDNNTDVMDHNGHGTHCAGIIAAEANNGKGVAGMTAGANVKIMMLKTQADDDDGTKLYAIMGSYNYVLKARNLGVNVAVTSNSFGRDDTQSTIFTEIVNRLGEAGIVSFYAAGNAGLDLDRKTDNPASNESEYSVVVGAGDITGEPIVFSNYGRTTVDIFAPGINLLSTVGYKCYLPGIYSDEYLAKTTEYFGKFTTDLAVTGGTVTPYAGDVAGVRSFGSMQFRKQKSNVPGAPEDYPDTASCEVELASDHYFTIGKNAASLKVTIKDAQFGEEYFIFFPYYKNPDTKDDNTMFSILYQGGSNPEGTESSVICGEVVKNDKGGYEFTGYGKEGYNLNHNFVNVGSHIFNDPEKTSENNPVMISDYEEGRETGIGLCIKPQKVKADGERMDIELYLDSLGVSRPGTKLSLENAYDIMSGTSMACPAAAGTGALIAALYPKKDSQTGSEYATFIRNKLFSSVRKTDKLSGLCSTGGYVDLRLLQSANPVIRDAVCDIDAGTLTLYGENMDPGMKLSFRMTEDSSSKETVLPAEGMTAEYAADGKSVVIRNAKKLFGSYVEFVMSDGGDRSGKGNFFTVKGQKKLDQLLTKHYPNPAENNGIAVQEEQFRLITDAKGSRLLGMNKENGALYVFERGLFTLLRGTDLKETVLGELRKEGYNDYQLVNDVRVEPDIGVKALTEGNMLYVPVKCTTTKDPDGDEEETMLMASADLSKEIPSWSLEKVDVELGSVINTGAAHAIAGGRIYSVSIDGSTLNIYDIAGRKASEGAAPPEAILSPELTEYNGSIYMMFGSSQNKDKSQSVSDRVYRYDISRDKWERTGTLRYAGKWDRGTNKTLEYQTTVARAKNGIVLMNMTIDGAGNFSLYDPENDSVTPLYYTINDGMSDQPYMGTTSSVATRDGLYYLRDDSDEMRRGYGLWVLPAASGVYENYYDASVDPSEGDGAALSITSAKLDAGDNVSLKVTGGRVSSWTSSDSAVASVADGKVTALTKGSAVITATLDNGEKLSCSVNVRTSPKLSKKTVTVRKGRTVKVKITGKAADVDNAYRNTKKAKITSKKNAATIKVRGLKRGKTTVKVRVNGKWLSLRVKVK